MNVTDLTTFGWDDFFEANFKTYAESGYTCGRVVLEHKTFFRVYTQHGEVIAEISGRLRHEAVNRRDLPAVGDWVLGDSARPGAHVGLRKILDRKSCLVRKAAGTGEEPQVLAANVDGSTLGTS